MSRLLYSQGNLDWILTHTAATSRGTLEDFLHWGIFKNSLDDNLLHEGRLNHTSLYEEEYDGPFYIP